MFIFLIIAIFINHIHGSASTIKEIDGKSYSFHTDYKGQHQASSACRKEGGKLFEPRNRSTYEKVMNEVGFNNIWLGINDDALEGNFVYQSDNSVLLLNDLWASGHPKNSDHNEDCVVGLGKQTFGYKLYNQACWYNYTYVCEKNGHGKSNKIKIHKYFLSMCM